MNSLKHTSSITRRLSREATPRDEELLRAARAGSHAAFAELQRIHSRYLYRRILSMTKNREDAEDALQDAFLCAYRALPSFEGRSRFSTWMTRIAVNSALMVLRKRRLRQEILVESQSGADEDGPLFDVRDDGLSPEQLCDQHQRCKAVLSAVQRLDPILRNALSIRISQGNSIEEIAQRLGVSSAAVKARLHRARLLLVKSPALRKQALELTAADRIGLSRRHENLENVA
jgi:RNA polymerase sigma-70 factor (ECF subfamily)